jgi:hypothetical protein
MSEDSTTETDSKRTIIGQRTYRVSARLIKNFPQVMFLFSPRAHRLYHIQETTYPEYAGVKWESLNKEEQAKVPRGFLVLDIAIEKRFNRDLANFARTNFPTATLEELASAKFEESMGYIKKLEMIEVDDNE